MRNELTQIREQISNLPHVQSGELEAKIQEAEERIETESLSIKQERELNTKIKGWRVEFAGCGVMRRTSFARRRRWSRCWLAARWRRRS